MSIARFWAKPLRIDPARNVSPPMNIDIFLPRALVTTEAQNEATKAAR